MKDTAERMRRVKERAEELRRRREKRSLWTLSGFCLLLSLVLLQTFVLVTGDRGGTSVQDMLGATLMFEDAGAYVLVGVVSFTAAVVITILCLRCRYKRDTTEKRDIQEKEKDLGGRK